MNETASGGKELSRSVHALLDGRRLECDVLIVGSGYGGAFAARELARSGARVWVLERGREYRTGEFPESIDEAVGHIRYSRDNDKAPIGNSMGLFDIRAYKDCAFVTGSGIGGGSLINAGVVVAPRREVFSDDAWPKRVRDDIDRIFSLGREVTRTLGAQPFPGTEHFAKYQSLQRLAGALRGVTCEPAPIAVTSRDGVNACGVEQKACIGCGNCVTGCNYQAKNTLALNVIPQAVTAGAQFFTGATVLSLRCAPGAALSPSGRPLQWCVKLAPTPETKSPDTAECIDILAADVILCAGALGSTEILLRSLTSELCFSPMLGRRFSGNGDMLAFGFGQGRPVYSTAHMQAPDQFANVGPTILGMIRPDGPESALPADTMIEDGSIPYSLAPFMGTLLSTIGLAYLNTHDEMPRFLADRPESDPIGLHPELLNHSQTLLAMSGGHGDGNVWLDAGAQPPFGKLRVSLKYALNDPVSLKLHGALKRAEAGAFASSGFDGGYYITNPLWKLLPDEFAEVTDDLDGQVLSVHPLGGCPMGESVRTGVVDDLGRVYNPRGSRPESVHAGLHVMDGAFIPVGLGANPLWTISALSLRAARALAAQYAAAPGRAASTKLEAAAFWQPPLRPRLPVTPPGATEVCFREVLYSRTTRAARQRESESTQIGLALSEAWRPVFDHFAEEDQGRSLYDRVVEGRAGLAMRFDVGTSLQSWLRDPSETCWTGSVQLTTYDLPDEIGEHPQASGFFSEARTNPFDGMPVSIFRNGKPAEGTATLELLALDRPADAADFLDRIDLAMTAYPDRRQVSREKVAARRRVGIEEDPAAFACVPSPEDGRIQSASDSIGGLGQFMRRGALHVGWRELRYEAVFDLPMAGGTPRSIHLVGCKRLAYAHGVPQIWDALLEMEVELTIDGDPRSAVTVPMRVDVLDLMRGNLYQFSGQRTSLETIVGLVDLIGLWLRALIGTHYWAFAGSNYTRRAPVPAAMKPLSHVRLASGALSAPTEHWFFASRGGSDRERADDQIRLRLSHFESPLSPSPALPPLLLVHGLAHGGELFATQTAEQSMVGYFLDHGRDVWVLDHRLSNLLGDTCKLPTSIDDVARFDIPAALEVLFCELGRRDVREVDVFAHCIGAAAFAMSVLGGHVEAVINDKPRNIGALILHAVHPWIVPSPYNRVSAALAAFYRDALEDEVIQVVPPISKADWPDMESLVDADPPPTPAVASGIDQIIDRLAASLPWSHDIDDRHFLESEATCDFARALCNRVTLFYGPDWTHDNVSPATLSALGDIMGAAHIDYFKHIFFCLLRHRLTDHDGADVYVKQENFTRYWKMPTLFATGLDNRVFDPRSAAKSFLLLDGVLNTPETEHDPKTGHVTRKTSNQSMTYPVALYMPPGVGHMDFVFGSKNAERFAVLSEFLRDPAGYAQTRVSDAFLRAAAMAPDHYIQNTPLGGPIIDYQVLNSDGRTDIRLNIWFELRPYGTEVVKPADTVEIRGSDQERGGSSSVRQIFLRANDRVGGIVIPGNFLLLEATVPLEAVGSLGQGVALPGVKFGWQSLPIEVFFGMTKTQRGRLVLEASASASSSGSDDPVIFATSLSPTPRILDGSPTPDAIRAPVPDKNPIDDKQNEDRRSDVQEVLRNKIRCVFDLDKPWTKRLVHHLDPRSSMSTATRILLGSCRWPGLFLETDAIEHLFAAMLERARAASPHTHRSEVHGCDGADALFLLGDQIYVDAVANVVDTTESAERAAARYRAAFTGDVRYDEVFRSHAMRDLLSELPTWMVLDDHEFSDNWSGWRKDLPASAEDVYSFGQRFAAAVTYQWRRELSASTLADNPSLGPDGVVQRGLWRPFQVGAIPCFAMDTRSERQPASARRWQERRMFSADQADALIAWLEETRDWRGVRFVLCGSPFGLLRQDECIDPSTLAMADDWAGYPSSIKWMAEALLDHDADNVVFVSGDPHLSCAARITLRRPDKSLVVHSVVSSGLNAPLPFANAKARDFVTAADYPLRIGRALEMHTQIRILSDEPRQFAELTFLPARGSPADQLLFDIHTTQGPMCSFRVCDPAAYGKEGACHE
ncbi:MAG: alkaline phosphatase D family protein [Burkholderiaceae bacterium]